MGRVELSLLCACVAVAVSAGMAVPASATVGCDRVAAPTGSDAADGTAAHPFRTVQRLADALAPGEAGCLRTGTYAESPTVTRGGREGAPVTLRSWPGDRVTIVGRLVVTKTANFVTVEELWLDGRNPSDLPSPTVNGSDVIFQRNDVTNGHTAICFVLGASNVDSSVRYGRAARSQVLNNRIHDCGQLPAANHDHGIYVEGTDDARIAGNWIYDNADRGIQLYPDAQRTEITGNVLDGNGTNVIFSGDLGVAANGNVVRGNLITNATTRFNVESWYPDGNPKGVGNELTANCVRGAARDDSGPAGVNIDDGGFSASKNLTADPQYSDRASHDYRIGASSPCAAVFLGNRAAVPGPTTGGASAGPPPGNPTAPTASGTPAPGGPGSAPAAPSAPPRGGVAGPRPTTSAPSRPQRSGGPKDWTVRLSTLAAAATKHASVRCGSRLRLGGHVDGPNAAAVIVQTQVKGAWRAIARTRSAASGSFSASWRLPRACGKRPLRLRATLPTGVRSNVLALTVKR